MLKLLENYRVYSTPVPNMVDPKTGRPTKRFSLFSDLEPEPATGSSHYFVLVDDDQPVAAATLYVSEDDEWNRAIIKRIDTDYRHLRKGYSTRLTEMLNDWAQARGKRLQSDWELSAERLPFWLKQVAKGRAEMTNPDDPSETSYRLIAPPGTNLDGIWQPWSPPWGRR